MGAEEQREIAGRMRPGVSSTLRSSFSPVFPCSPPTWSVFSPRHSHPVSGLHSSHFMLSLLFCSGCRLALAYALPNLATSLHLCCIASVFWPHHPFLGSISMILSYPPFMGSLLFFPTAIARGGCRCGHETWAATAPQPTSSSLSSATCTPMGARALYSLQPHKDHTTYTSLQYSGPERSP